MAPAGPESFPSYITARADGCDLTVRVVPRAGRSAIAGTRGGALLVRLAAAPVDGAANAALLALMAHTLDLPRHAVTLVGGEWARDKRVRVAALTASQVRARLAAAGAE